MKIIPLTQGYFAYVDDEDYDFLRQWKWNSMIMSGGQLVYARRKENARISRGENISVLMHRVIAERAGLDISRTIDHRDRNGLMNTRNNLRPASRSEQQKNRSRQRNNTSGIKGVFFNKRRPNKPWFSSTSVDGVPIFLGTFRTKEEAATAYANAVARYFGDFAPTQESPP